MDYHITRRIIRLGKTSLVIVIPKIWAEAHKIKPGQKIEITFDNYGYLKIKPLSQTTAALHISSQEGAKNGK